MTQPRHVKLFRNNQNQAVRIPRDFELPGTDAIIWREGDRLIIEPAPTRPSLVALLDGWKGDPLGPEEELPEIDDPPPEPVEL
jgi:antitoxin VapB